jgi:hypothetical protein
MYLIRIVFYTLLYDKLYFRAVFCNQDDFHIHMRLHSQ